MKNHKAQANQALLTSVVGVVVLLVAIGVIFATSFKALGQLTTMAEDASAAHANQTITWVGNTSKISLAENRIQESTILVYNNGSLINQGAGANANYTTDPAGVTIINSTPGGGNAKGLNVGTWVTNAINVSYSYYYGSQERNISLQSNEGVKVVSDFQPTWAIVIAVAILILALLIPLTLYVMNKF